MFHVIKYDGTNEELLRIKAQEEAKGMTFVEVQNIKEGNFIGFCDNPIPTPTPLEEKINSIQNTVDILLLKQEGIL